MWRIWYAHGQSREWQLKVSLMVVVILVLVMRMAVNRQSLNDDDDDNYVGNSGSM